MLAKHEIDCVPLAELAVATLKSMDDIVDAFAGEIQVLRDDIQTIGSLALKSEAGEREKALSFYTSAHETAKQHLEQVRRSGGLGGLGSPIKTARGLLALREARTDLAQAESVFDAPAAASRREGELRAHNNYVTHEQNRLASVQGMLRDRIAAKIAAEQLRAAAADAIVAARNGGWKDSTFSATFRDLAHCVHMRDVVGASERLTMLLFQRLPSSSDYGRWAVEAKAIRTRAYSDHAGMAASGSYAEIASHSVDLARKSLRSEAEKILASFSHPAEQWQALSALLLDPRHLRTDALWAVYWAMFQCGQWMANTSFESDEHEDITNGKLSAQIDRWLVSWAAHLVPQFGYPETASYMGTFDIANKKEETRLGADIGLIIDLNIGDLVCRKVALFQAKKAKKGSADIGSDTDQLSKLAARPQLGFYLFYHQLPAPLFPPAPSVVCAHELSDMVQQSDRSPHASSLTLKVNGVGWDWASFISFGLCEPASPHGVTFTTVSDAFAILGGGNPGHLPRYLHMIAITDAPRVRELRMEIHKHYHERIISKSRDLQANRDRDRNADRRDYDRDADRSGPEMSM